MTGVVCFRVVYLLGDQPPTTMCRPPFLVQDSSLVAFP